MILKERCGLFLKLNSLICSIAPKLKLYCLYLTFSFFEVLLCDRTRLIGSLTLKQVKINNREFNWEQLDEKSRSLLDLLQAANDKLSQSESEIKILNLAKIENLSRIKKEIMIKKSGFDPQNRN